MAGCGQYSEGRDELSSDLGRREWAVFHDDWAENITEATAHLNLEIVFSGSLSAPAPAPVMPENIAGSAVINFAFFADWKASVVGWYDFYLLTMF